ncbi:uncharacterized protein LOC132697116 [Cylas formicarius]|uniref:uncharacterized protein LOC132697116 n=1 Tax=Cylas formicarius TaxID=197179 RepID=UPI0029588E71|nr:uncharacterized protein LOC132697116 [Cylas formicarius]
MRRVVVTVILLVFRFGDVRGKLYYVTNSVDRYALIDCINFSKPFECFVDQISDKIEDSRMSDIPLAEGIMLLRNGNKVNPRRARNLKGLGRLETTIWNFFDTHSIALELGTIGSRQLKDGENRAGNKKEPDSLFSYEQLKKERKYVQYAFMVLLGIFGLTGPLIMKVVAIMAAKALLASKAALIIVGSVALKKLFQKEYQKPSVSVHTIKGDEEDDYDRIGHHGYNYIYGSTYYNNYPYAEYSWYESNSDNIKDANKSDS